ncbi:MAG: GTPase Era [Candidatus Aminicenantes bacterium]|nr:GTPase Era [Candidatus Aminicenantes bacterium]
MNEQDQPTHKSKVGYVSLIGRPNVGKSTLLNNILGQKVSIISDKPQTTRISILGIKTTRHGQIVFIDNPGIHKPLHKLNKRMMSFVYSSLQTADVICLLIDATLKFGHGDEFVLETLKKVSTPVFLLINKVDIIRKEKVLPLIDKYKDLFSFAEIIPISALKGTNTDVLEQSIYQHLPEAEHIYSEDELSTQSQKFLLSEIIREKMLQYVEKELPFVTAVLINKIQEKKAKGKPLHYIHADIIVEKDNHRRIILGRQGSLIKKIGTEARKEIQKVLESKVFLDLHVRVKKRWRDSANVLELIEQQ